MDAEPLNRLPRNVASRREFERYVRYWCNEIGFPHPWTASCVFHNAAKGDHTHETDPLVYCCVQSQPQYHRLIIHADLRHTGWLMEPNIQACIRHELFHAFVSLYTQSVSHLVTDPAIERILDDLEDELVNRLSALPLLRHVPEA